MSSIEKALARYGLIKDEYRHLIFKEKLEGEDISAFWNWDSTGIKAVMIPLGAWEYEDSNIGTDPWHLPPALDTPATANGVGLRHNEICAGGVYKMTLMNDSIVDFATVSMCLWKFRQMDADAGLVPDLDPSTPFDVSDALGKKSTWVKNLHRDKKTAKLYSFPHTIHIAPKHMISMSKRYLAPKFMKSATRRNENFAYGIRMDYDTTLKISVEIHRKVHNSQRVLLDSEDPF